MKKIIRKLWKEYGSLLVIPILFIMPSLYFYYLEPTPLVIFAGGGSVYKFLKNVKHIDIKDSSIFTNHVYINLPSEYVKQMLEEEINRFADDERNNPGQPVFSYSCNGRNYKECKLESHHPFLYIGLSAKSIDSIDYHGNHDIAQVYEYFIGIDSLVAYTINKTTTILCDTITIDSLRKLIITNDSINISKKDSITIYKAKDNVYATSRKSGTFLAYRDAFRALHDSISGFELFFAKDQIKSGGIVLGSVFYNPENYENKYRRYYIKDTMGKILTKQLFIYFVAYRDSKDKFKPNSQIIEFLNKIHPDSVIDDKNWERKDSIKIKQLKMKKKKKYLSLDN